MLYFRYGISDVFDANTCRMGHLFSGDIMQAMAEYWHFGKFAIDRVIHYLLDFRLLEYCVRHPNDVKLIQAE
jgi:hypothetical protein